MTPSVSGVTSKLGRKMMIPYPQLGRVFLLLDGQGMLESTCDQVHEPDMDREIIDFHLRALGVLRGSYPR